MRVMIRVARGGIRGLLSLCEGFGCTITAGFFSWVNFLREGLDTCSCNDDGKSKSHQEVGRHRVRPTRAETIM
jgi:hypothetical protein